MPQEGDVIGQYRLIRRVGGGAFGEVWLVRHLDLDTERAMKIPTDADCVRQLRREARIQCAVRHPNIVQTLELDLRDEPPRLVMEYVDGQDLRKRLGQRGRLSVYETLALLCEVLEALEAAHKEGVLHRDLKPENILVAQDGRVKVADFGLGRVQAELVQSLVLSGSMVSSAGKSVSGTYAYMSPEQQAGGEPSPRDDVYSLGLIACELLTGKRPTAAGVTTALQRADIPEPVAEIVHKACDDFEHRYPSAREMLADVEALVTAGPTGREQAPAAVRASVPTTPRRRSGGLVVAIIAALVVVLTAIVALLTVPTRHPRRVPKKAEKTVSIKAPKKVTTPAPPKYSP